MGLLDDAIRDHLELKRRHGASADEIARQEKEALGPVRREAPMSAAEAEAAAPAVFDGEDDEGLDDDEYDPRPGDRVVETTDEEEPLYDEDLLDDEDEPPAAADIPDDEQPTASAGAVRLDDDDVVAGEDDPDGEDVLEETPDFLQETPEHDRLWFEQKPPKDFDF